MTAAEIKVKINEDQRWLEHAVLAIDARQTQDESVVKVTKHRNGCGWKPQDAKEGGRLASFLRRCTRPDGQRLCKYGNGRDGVAEARELMQKYCSQLAKVAKANKAAA